MPSRSIDAPSRRSFLAATTGGLLAAGLAGRIGRAAEQTGDYGPFQMGIQSYSLRNFNFDEALAKTKELGLGAWESYSAHIAPTTDQAKLDAILAKMKAAGVTLAGFGVVRMTKDVDALRPVFAFAKAAGIKYLSADPDPDAFDAVDKLVEEYGVAVGIHNHGPGHRYDKIDTIAAAIKDHNPKIGCCIDTGHFLRSREDPVRAAEVFGDRIYGVHLKDVKDATTFTVLGKGDLRTADLLKELARRKYGYCLALEYEENPDDPIADIQSCLEAVRKAVKGI